MRKLSPANIPSNSQEARKLVRQFLLFLEQDYVGGVVSVQDGEGFTIWRPCEFGDAVSGKVRDLVPNGAIERLHEDVVHAFITDDLGDRFSVWRECEVVDDIPGVPNAWIGANQPRRGW